MRSNELKHFGIKGMRWGVRRQLSKSERKAKARKERKAILESPKKLRKNLDRYDDKTIQNAIKRMQIKRELKNLERDELRHGSQFAKEILAYGAVGITAITMYNTYKKILK